MKIALVIGTLDVGGTEMQLGRLAEELTVEGHDVAVYALASDGPVSAALDGAGVRWRAFGLGTEWSPSKPAWRQLGVGVRDLGRLVTLWRELRVFRPDVYHGFLFWAYIPSLPVAALAGVPVRVSARRGLVLSLGKAQKYRRLPRFVNALTHAVVANSQEVAAEAVAVEGLSPGKIRVIRNGVDIPESPAPVERQPPIGLMVANLIAYKGHRDLIEAIALLACPPRIRVIGEGPERPALEDLLAEKGLSDVVVLEGPVEDAASLYRDVQFGILASHHEGLPNAVLEAMAAGVPMVATAVGGVTELIRDGETGLLVPPQQPAALAEAIDRVARDPDLRCRLGSAARTVAQSFSWDACRRAHVDLYRELGAEGRGSTAPAADAGRRAAKVLATTVVKVGVVVTAGITAIFSARILRPSGRGAYYVLASVATTAISMGHLSLDQAHTYLWSKGANRRSLVANGVFLGMIVGVFTGGAAWAVVRALGPDRVPVASYWLLGIAALTVPPQMVVLYLNTLLILDDRIGRVNAGSALATAVLFTGTFALALAHHYTLHTMVVLWAVCTALPLVVLLTAFEVRVRDVSARLARQTVALGARYHMGMAALFLLWRVDVLLLNARVSRAQVGLYSVAVALAELMYLLTDTVAQVALPRQVVGSLAESGRYTARAMRSNTVLAFLALLATIALAPALVPRIFGQSFRGSVPALIALGPGVLALATVRPVSGFIVRLNRPFHVSAATGSALVINVVLNLVLIPHIGIVGASLASTAAYGFLAVVYLVWLCRAASIPAAELRPRLDDLREPIVGLLTLARRWRRVAHG